MGIGEECLQETSSVRFCAHSLEPKYFDAPDIIRLHGRAIGL